MKLKFAQFTHRFLRHVPNDLTVGSNLFVEVHHAHGVFLKAVLTIVPTYQYDWFEVNPWRPEKSKAIVIWNIFVSFDHSFFSVWSTTLRHVPMLPDYCWPTSLLRGFFQPECRHHRSLVFLVMTETRVPDQESSAYSTSLKLCGTFLMRFEWGQGCETFEAFQWTFNDKIWYHRNAGGTLMADGVLF